MNKQCRYRYSMPLGQSGTYGCTDFACVKEDGHDGEHGDGLGGWWPSHEDMCNGFKVFVDVHEPNKDEIAELVKHAELLVAFCNIDGSPCDGFRFREEVLATRAALEAFPDSPLKVAIQKDAERAKAGAQ